MTLRAARYGRVRGPLPLDTIHLLDVDETAPPPERAVCGARRGHASWVLDPTEPIPACPRCHPEEPAP